MLKINTDKCTGCELCLDECPYDALYMQGDIAQVDRDKCTLCGICTNYCHFSALELAAESHPTRGDKLAEYDGVWVLAEQRGGDLLTVSLELISEAKKLAAQRNTTISAVVLGENVQAAAKELIAWGADRVFLGEDSQLKEYRTEPYTRLISELIQEHKPEIVLLGATHNGRDLGPRLAARLSTGLTADCTELKIDEEKGILRQTRPAFGGNLMATIVCPEHRPQMATVRPGVMAQAEPDYSRQGEVIEIPCQLKEEEFRTKIRKVVKEAKAAVNLEKAEVIVAGGRGVGSAENFKLIEKLAACTGGEVGASRAAVDSGWIAKEHQVGQTGKTVKPTIYIACGISGAIQHKAGMQNADYIIAINKDPQAPIFDVCDYGIAGDLNQAIPVLLEELK